MTKIATATDLSHFETALVRDGAKVDVVLRRRGPAILDRLAQRSRQSVATYIATAEAVLAGGASMPRDSLSAGSCGGGPGSREGRQSGAVDQVRFLRHMELAVASQAIQVGRRNPVSLAALDVWRSICLGDKGVEAILASHGMKPAKSRVADLNAGFIAAAERVADAIGATHSPF